MRWRRIDEAVVLQALAEPDREETAVGGRVNRWKRVSDGLLRVTCRIESDEIVVISAVVKRGSDGEETRR